MCHTSDYALGVIECTANMHNKAYIIDTDGEAGIWNSRIFYDNSWPEPYNTCVYIYAD